ncbi:Protein CBG20252 [Caenorhabditis briggsae]|uniref:Uncharacterized protein n=2 Tax=Caenorhabditis briggsae TaxID=6238 RepID=A0AAE9DY96_CAEBR|nr:Protein CBG20252 [Caenorhabditis briggsae]ULU13264.1 hypothetical protein L3Y34_016043 [Caenorhabditis briggsae]CAP37331.1 Protein CBG20252 [Caenorhabditis briggsae]
MDRTTGPNHPPPPEKPKFLCIPARPFTCFITIFGILKSASSFYQNPNAGTGAFAFILLTIDLLILVGLSQNTEKCYLWTLKVTFIGLGFITLQFLIYPVIVASSAASGSIPNAYAESAFQIVNRTFGGNDEMFLRGVMAGYVMELAFIFMIALQFVKAFLITRLWDYEKTLEEMR